MLRKIKVLSTKIQQPFHLWRLIAKLTWIKNFWGILSEFTTIIPRYTTKPSITKQWIALQEVVTTQSLHRLCHWIISQGKNRRILMCRKELLYTLNAREWTKPLVLITVRTRVHKDISRPLPREVSCLEVSSIKKEDGRCQLYQERNLCKRSCLSKSSREGNWELVMNKRNPSLQMFKWSMTCSKENLSWNIRANSFTRLKISPNILIWCLGPQFQMTIPSSMRAQQRTSKT